jgi:hypothetical protein
VAGECKIIKIIPVKSRRIPVKIKNRGKAGKAADSGIGDRELELCPQKREKYGLFDAYSQIENFL